jgi:hypothetical protein
MEDYLTTENPRYLIQRKRRIGETRDVLKRSTPKIEHGERGAGDERLGLVLSIIQLTFSVRVLKT